MTKNNFNKLGLHKLWPNQANDQPPKWGVLVKERCHMLERGANGTAHYQLIAVLKFKYDCDNLPIIAGLNYHRHKCDNP
jgi:hypothetical protein